FQRFPKLPASLTNPGKQVFALDRLLYGERARTGGRMANIGKAVLEGAAARHDRLVDFLGKKAGTDRLIASSQPLGAGDYVRGDGFLLAGEEASGSSHAAHHLVEDQQDAISVTDFPDALEITRYCRDGAQRGTDHRFGNEGDDCFRTKLLYLGFQLIGDTKPIGLGSFILCLPPVGVARRDVVGRKQDGFVDLSAARIA